MPSNYSEIWHSVWNLATKSLNMEQILYHSEQRLKKINLRMDSSFEKGIGRSFHSPLRIQLRGNGCCSGEGHLSGLVTETNVRTGGSWIGFRVSFGSTVDS